MEQDQTEPAVSEGADEAPGRFVAHDPYTVLRDPNFRRLVLAGMVATVGNQMQGVAVGWELYERTGSPLALGMVGLAQVLPVLLLAIPAGHAADRHSRKGQIVLAHGLLLITSLGLAFLSARRGPVGLTYLFLVLTGVGQALNRPARWAILPQVVPRALLLSAVTWSTSAWQVAAMAGPALGGLVIALTAGATTCYVLNAGCSAVVIALTASLRLRAAPRDAQPVSLRSLLAGLRFVVHTDLILATITLDLMAVFLGGATALLPIYARDILRIGPSGLGWLRAAPSIGSFLMALVLAHRPPMRQAGKSLLWAVAGFGIATVVFGLSRNPYLSFAMLLLTGALDNISVVVRQTLVQLLTPDEMRGRVSAINAIFIASSNELGEFESGLAARLFGTVAAVVGGGVGTVLVVLCVAAIWPSISSLGSLHDVDASQR
jgi:MFS family permease